MKAELLDTGLKLLHETEATFPEESKVLLAVVWTGGRSPTGVVKEGDPHRGLVEDQIQVMGPDVCILLVYRQIGASWWCARAMVSRAFFEAVSLPLIRFYHFFSFRHSRPPS